MEGNQQKMREAMVNIAEYAKNAQCHTEDAHVLGYLRQMENWAQSALASPPRNCDVGTAEEQAKRFKKFCNKHCRGSNVRFPCLTCPLPVDKCQLAWAQMPYAQEGAGK